MKMPSKGDFLKNVEKIDKLDVCLILTLFLLVTYGGQASRVSVPVTILTVPALVFADLRKSPKFWFALAVTFIFANSPDWYRLDNHKFLLAYWCVAIFCSLSTRFPDRALAVNGRVLIGLTFLFAVAWKLISSDYQSGSFFEYSLMLDNRFAGVSELLGGMTEEMREFNHAAREALLSYDSELTAVQLRGTSALQTLAWRITWWTLGIESLIAICFLLPPRTVIGSARDLILLVFLFSTYSLAPVVGFGWLLAIMGLAQARQSAHGVWILYVVAMLTVQASRLV